MAGSLNVEIQDAGVLLTASKKYQAELTGVGSPESETEHLQTVIEALTLKDVEHESAVNHVRQLTGEQNTLIARSWNIIGKIKAAVKVHFFRDKLTQKEFHIGAKVVQNVASTLAELASMIGLTTTYAVQLLSRGIGEADKTELNACYAGLQAKDSEQENAKRVKVALRNERDALLADLKDSKIKIRGSAAICFRGNKDVLYEFKSIIRRSSSRKSSGDTTTDAPVTG